MTKGQNEGYKKLVKKRKTKRKIRKIQNRMEKKENSEGEKERMNGINGMLKREKERIKATLKKKKIEDRKEKGKKH